VRPPRMWGRAKAANDPITDSTAANEAITDPASTAAGADPKAANEAITDSVAQSWPRAARSPIASACEPYRDLIEEELGRGRNAKAIWQDLVTEHGFGARYASLQRFAQKLRAVRVPEACGVIDIEPGEEAQVYYGEEPMVRGPDTGKYRRMRLLLMTLGYSRKSVRLLTRPPTGRRRSTRTASASRPRRRGEPLYEPAMAREASARRSRCDLPRKTGSTADGAQPVHNASPKTTRPRKTRGPVVEAPGIEP